MSSAIRPIASILVAVVLGNAALHAADASRAAEMMKNKQYRDAIKILLEDIKGKGDADTARQALMLGECYYLTSSYDEAKPWFAKAFKNCADEKDKATAAYRIPIVAYKLKDYSAASVGIDAFLSQFQSDSRGGKLMVYKMSIVSAKGRNALADIEALHHAIQLDLKKYGYATGMEADGLLTDFYRANDQPDKARDLLAQAVHNFRNVIAEYKKDNAPVPAGLEKYHDNSALQLGFMCAERKEYGPAATWLENVRYDPDSKMKARLLLAKIAYEQTEYAKAIGYLADPAFLDTVPEGQLKSDMFLILGVCEKSKKNINAAKVEEYLKKVAPSTKGYPQAQLALGDVYREKGVTAQAVKAYSNVMEISEYAAAALYNLGCIYMDDATKAADAAGSPNYKAASASFGQLLAKYPLSAEAKKARERIDELAKKGVAVTASGGGDDSVAIWKKTVEKQKGTAEGAQALLSLARHYAKQIADEKTKKIVQAPNYKECAAACDELLDAKIYGGKGLSDDAWKALRAEANWQRGVCELGSAEKAPAAGTVAPVLIPNADVERAIAYFDGAKRYADPKNLELIRSIDLGLLEALFKSTKKEHKEAAETRFNELEPELGSDPRFLNLTLDLAEWYRTNGRFADAAKAYAGIADRGKEMSEEDTLKVLYQAGSLYSKAGFDAQQKQGETAYAIYIYPKETLKLGGGVLTTYEPLQREIKAMWPAKAPFSGQMKGTPREALVALSKMCGVPFVWSEKGDKEFIHYLSSRRVALKDGLGTPAKFLAQILDLDHQRLDFDLGFTGGTPTLNIKPNKDDPAAANVRTIEIYDERNADKRFPPLARSYGGWSANREKNKKNTGGVMLLTVLARIEETSQTKFIWAEGVEKGSKLAAEFHELPAIAGGDPSCAKVLAAVLDAQGLNYRIVPREVAAEFYEKAKDSFNKIRKIDPKSRYGERSLFALALNYYNVKDYAKMKIVLKEYLKVFDNPNNDYYHSACYYLGWLFDREHNSREACGYYARAAEERLVFFRRDDVEKLEKEGLKKELGTDVVFALSEPLAGEIKNKRLADFADFIKLNTHVEVRLDPHMQSLNATFNKAAFKNVSALDLICELLAPGGVGVRGENINKEVAEKAYYRLASVYAKDNVMDQALENINTLIERYPNTDYRKDACALKLGIYKGLKDYRNVLATLDELKKIGGNGVEP